MADKKVSQLTALTGANAASGDLLYIVDVSEPVAADQSKKITLTEFQSAPVSAGTANGVAFLNASKVLTTGSALTFDGTNLGLGVTPSAWGSNFKAMDFGGNVGIAGYSNSMYQLTNAYAENAAYKYKASTFASAYLQTAGQHQWYTAPSGTAGNTISFTQAMTLDASGNLGVGTTSPSDKLTVAAGRIRLDQDFQIVWQNAGTNRARILGDASSNIIFETGSSNTERARITSVGNFKIGGTADRATTEGTNQLVLFNGTAPVGTLTNGVSFYSESGEARVMDAAGNSTLLSPHDTATNEWIFHSKHTPTGKVLRIDVERLLKFVNDHFGLDAVHEFIEE